MIETTITADEAFEGFNRGVVCSQATFSEFATQFGMDRETALKVSSAFGGGTWRGEQCGCVVGGLMALGLKYGQGDVVDPEKERIRKAKCDEFMRRFAEKHGSCICREILGLDHGKPDEYKKILEQNLYSKICCHCVTTACGILKDLLND